MLENFQYLSIDRLNLTTQQYILGGKSSFAHFCRDADVILIKW